MQTFKACYDPVAHDLDCDCAQSLTPAQISAIRQFYTLFVTADLYRAGYSDAVERCGVRQCSTRETMLSAIAFLHGYGSACELANTYLSKEYRIAEAFAVAAFGIHMAILMNDSGADIDRMCERRIQEIRTLLAM
jgi:hypothetical protein